MILSTKHKFIFWHVPKTAGMSVREQLEPYGVDLGKLFGHKWVNRYLAKNWFHINQADFKQEVTVTGLQASNYKEIAFVRNPYQVMVSKYNYFQLLQADKPNAAEKVSFDDFLTMQINDTNGGWMSLPQTHWTSEPLSSRGVQIFKVEDLPLAWDNLQEYIGLKLAPLGHNNVSWPREFDANHLTPEQRDRIYGHFRCDFEAFGYPR